MPRRLVRGLILGASLALVVVPLPGANAAFPGGDGQLAYACSGGICINNGAGSAEHTLSGIPAGATDPAWSQDGTKLAYVVPSGGSGSPTTIRTATVSGTSASQTAFTSTAGIGQPSWAPTPASGQPQQLVYSDGTNVWTVNADTSGNAQQITSSGHNVDPVWAPTNAANEIAFASDASGSYHIVTTEPDGSQPFHIGTNIGDARHPSYSPDASQIVFSSTQLAGGPFLYVAADNDGSSASLLGGPPGIVGDDPVWSPDGQKILFARGTQLWTVNADGSSPTQIVSTLVSGTHPDWQAVASGSSGGGGGTTGAPSNVTLPTIIFSSGATVPTAGQFVSATVGSWNGSFPITYKYQWKKCDPGQFGSCYDIPGATFSFYTPTIDITGFSLRVMVTATNSEGSSSQNSLPTDVVTALAPQLRVTPPIVGPNTVGATLAVGPGTWSGTQPITYSYEWRRCDPLGDNCVAIPGATMPTYTLTNDDLGQTIRVAITGRNAVGSDSGVTNHTFPTLPTPRFKPSLAGTLLVTGEARLGSTLVAVNGTWSGESPITYIFSWQRCDAVGSTCATMPDSKLEYKLGAADIGSTIRFQVTAHNAVGDTQIVSDPTDAIAAVPKSQLRGRNLRGTAGPDYLAGSGGPDTISGLGGNDTIRGGSGDDRLSGGAGNDVIEGGPGTDTIDGGAGSDTILAADGTVDTIDCGAGNDHAIVDTFDKVENCESVTYGSSSPGTGGTGAGGGDNGFPGGGDNGLPGGGRRR